MPMRISTHFIILLVGSVVYLFLFFWTMGDLTTHRGTASSNEGRILINSLNAMDGLRVTAIYLAFSVVVLGHGVLRRDTEAAP